MSSHHIIREKQEPALLIWDIGSFDMEYLGQLLEWSPTVMVSSLVYEQVYSFGIKIDVVIGNTEVSFQQQEHLKTIPLIRNNFIQTALSYLVSEEYPSVNVIAGSFRVDDYKSFVEMLDIVIFVEDKKIFPIKSSFSKWKSANEEIYFMDEDFSGISFSGLKTTTTQEYFLTIKDGFYSFSFDRDFIFIAEKYD